MATCNATSNFLWATTDLAQIAVSTMAVTLNVLSLTAVELHKLLSRNLTTSVAVVESYLNQIARHNHAGLELNAVISLASRDTLLSRARELDDERALGKTRGPLHGVPILIKDLINTIDPPTTCGSFALKQGRTTRNAAIVQILIEAGLIILGKTNLSEFGNGKGTNLMGGWSAVGGQTKSPYVRGEIDPDGASITHQGPTGSSSGSAVAVAAGFAPLSVGTELVGSIVTPASRAGVYAIKLTPESVDNAGVLPGCPGWDAQGPYAKTTHDLAIISAIMQVRDPEAYLPLSTSWQGLKLAFADPKSWNYLDYPPEVLERNLDFQKQIDDALYAVQDRIECEGGRVKRSVPVPLRKEIEAAMPDVDASGPLFQYQTKRLWPQYLAEFEGVPQTLDDLIQWHDDHADLEYTKRNDNVDAIKAANASSMTKEVFERNERVLRKTAHDSLLEILNENDADVIVGPGDSEINMVAAYAGWTVGAVPAGFANFNGRAWALHVLAPPGEEGRIFRFMAAWEATFPENVQPPPGMIGPDASL